MKLDVFNEHFLIFRLAQFHVLYPVFLSLNHLLIFFDLSLQLKNLLLLELEMQILLGLKLFQKFQAVLYSQVH
jgi:hypothetical protein